MSDITTFKPTIQDVKDIIESYKVDGDPAKCSDEDAQSVLDNWNDQLAEAFYDYVRDEFMEGEIFNSDSDEE